MTDTRYDRAPGDRLRRVETVEETSSGVLVSTIGLFLAVILTATSFWVANTSLLWAPGISLGLAVLAIAQMGVHLVFSCTSPPRRTTPTTFWRWRLEC
jgi:cytochrome o ubiquinol oxidase subunit IV